MTAFRSPAPPALVAAPGGTRPTVPALVWSASVLGALGGALSHLFAAVQHADHSELVSGFFVLVALAQFGGAALLAATALGLVRRRTEVLLAGIAATAGLILLYLVAHGTDLFDGLTGEAAAGGHHGGGAATGHAAEVEGPVALGVPLAETGEDVASGFATLAVELVTVVALTALLPVRARGRVVDGLFLLGALTWGLWFAGALR